MNRALIVGLMLALPGCSLFKGGLKAPSAEDMAAAKKAAEELAEKLSKAQAAAAEAIKKCPAPDANIPLTDEKEVGGAIMVAMANETGYFLVDGALPAVTAKPETVKMDMKNAKNAVNAYVAKVGKLLASYSSRPELPWTFGVVENDGVNAFSAPGGYVVLTTGLLRLVDNEAQLAGVLGHEIGHVVNKDVIKSYASVKNGICKPAVTVAAYIQYGIADQLPADVQAQGKFSKDFDGSNAGKASSALVDAITDGVLSVKKLLGMGKDAEFNADKVAFELMMFAGYDTAEFDKVLLKVEGGGKAFSNHPSNGDRVKALEKLRLGGKKDDGSPDPENMGYSMFATGGVVPAMPPEIKAAIPAEGTAKVKAPPPEPAKTEPAKDVAAKETPKS
jgi:Zn-dependent protease with chaperone function